MQIRVDAREDRGNGSAGPAAGRNGLSEDQSLAGQAVDIGGGLSLIAVTAEMVGPESVYDDKNDDLR